jgi:hypothetical protein
VQLQPRTWTVLAWLLFLASLGCCAVGITLVLVLVRPLRAGVLTGAVVLAMAYLSFAVIGLVLSVRRPANPIGWLYAASGLVWCLAPPGGEAWVDQLVRSGRPLPLTAKLYAASEPLWAPAIALGVTLPLLLLPDGRLRSGRWRLAAWASVTGATLLLAGVLVPRQLTTVPIANPFGLAGVAGTVANRVEGVGQLLYLGSLAAALICVVLRFRASRGVERQQLRWVAAGATGAVFGLVAVVGLLALEQWYGVAPGAAWVAVVLALPCLPVSVTVAVLRYRLWELDRVISRTLTYTLVTALLAALYLLVVVTITRLAQDAGSLAVAAATLTAAAAFTPLHRRVQDRVDRRFNRRRYDAARTVEAFAVRLRDQVDLDALHGELLAVVDQTVQPTQATLWLRSTAPHSPS